MGSLRADYNLRSFAPTWNIYEFLTGARIYADQVGVEKIYVSISKEALSEARIFQPQSVTDYNYRISDILIGALPMFPVAEFCLRKVTRETPVIYDFPPTNGELKEGRIEKDRYYLQAYLKEHWERGKLIPSIKIPLKPFEMLVRFKESVAPKKLVTITLRAAKFLSKKNSNVSVWDYIAQKLRIWGAEIVVLPDIESISLTKEHSPLAMLCLADQRYRAALYEISDLNLGVNNGSINSMILNANSRFVVGKLYSSGTNTSKEFLHRVLGDWNGASWMGVPWQRTLADEDADELVSTSIELLQDEVRTGFDLEIYNFFTDPLGRPDASVPQLRTFWIHQYSTPASKLDSIRAEIITELMSEKTLFHNAKSLIVRAVDAFLRENFEESIRLAKQSLLLEERYRDPYLLIGISLNFLKRPNESNQWLKSACGKSLFLFQSDADPNKIEIKNFL